MIPGSVVVVVEAITVELSVFDKAKFLCKNEFNDIIDSEICRPLVLSVTMCPCF